MGKVRAKGYTQRGLVFRNWDDSPDCFCPLCDRGYVISVEAPVSTVYVHSGNILHQRFNDEIGT